MIGVLDMEHWHVASGLAGYGPDAADSDGFAYAETPEGLADLIRDELNTWAEFEYETAQSYAEAEDFKAAWLMRVHSDEIDNLRANLDNKRVAAPMYRDDIPAWHATIARTVAEQFPYDVNEGRSRVYAWQCEEGDACESLQESD